MKKILENPFFQGSIYMMAASLIMGIMNYVFNIVCGRLLGPEGYGNVTTLFAYMAVLTIPLAALSNVLIQKIGARADEKLSYARAIETWTFHLYKKYWYIMGGLLLIIPFTPHITNLTPIAAYVIIPLFLISIMASVYDGILTGLHYFFIASAIGVLTILIKLMGAFLGYIVPYPLVTVILIFSLSLPVKILLNKRVLNSRLKNSVKEKKLVIEKSVMDILKNKQFLLALGSIFSISLINNGDMMYAKKIFSAEDAGLFAGWSLFAKVIIYVFAPFLTMSYVFFSNKREELHHHAVLIISFILMVGSGIALNIGYGLYDRLLIRLLLGDQYMSLKPFIEWAALFGIGYVLVMFMNYYFLAKESRATLILPIMTLLYFPGLVYVANSLSTLIFYNTVFMFVILFFYLLVFIKEKIISLLE